MLVGILLVGVSREGMLLLASAGAIFEAMVLLCRRSEGRYVYDRGMKSNVDYAAI